MRFVKSVSLLVRSCKKKQTSLRELFLFFEDMDPFSLVRFTEKLRILFHLRAFHLENIKRNFL